MSGTPETDAAVMAAGGDWSFPLRECSRRLERQRDEAREEAQQMSESNQLLMADVRFYRNAWEQLKGATK